MRSQSRAGFTLVELMVALALTMFLMVILTQCFVMSLETFSGMKGLGDMQQNLRTATTLLSTDLAEDHFEGKRRLSDPTIFNSSYPIQAGYFAIKQGSTAVSVNLVTPGTPPVPSYILEGADTNAIPSYRAVDHVLAFTVKRKGNRPDAFFTTALHGTQAVLTQFFFPLGTNARGTAYDMRSQPNSPFTGGSIAGFPPANPPAGYTGPQSYTDPTPDYATATFTTPYSNGGKVGFYSSQWAEVYYYLVATGTTEQPNNPLAASNAPLLGTPIYSLYRAQFVMVPDSTVVNSPAPPGTFPAALMNPAVTNPLPFQGLACCPFGANTTILFNSPIDAANRTVNGIVRRSIDVSSTAPAPIAFPITYPPTTGIDTRLIPNLGPLSGNTGTGSSEITTGKQTEGSTELVLPNVISFQVQLLDTLTNIGAFGDVPQATNVTNTPGYYDSSLLNQGNAGFSIKAIRVTLRVWDNATRQTRQVSFVQDL